MGLAWAKRGRNRGGGGAVRVTAALTGPEYLTHARYLVPQQATFAPSRRPARPLAAPAESPSTSSTRTSGRHTETTHRTPLLDGQTLPAGALDAGCNWFGGG